MALVAETSSLPASILVVDDEEIILHSLQEILNHLGYSVETANSGKQALEKINHSIFDLIICDIKMPHMTGIELLERIKLAHPNIQVIVITGFPSINLAIEAMKKGASDFITKPFDIDLIEHLIARTLNERRLVLENQSLMAEINQKAVIEKLNRDLKSKIEELTKLVMINERLNSLSDNEDVFTETVRLANEITSAERISLMTYDRKTGLLRIRAACGLGASVINNTRVHLGEGIAGKVAQCSKRLHKRKFDTNGIAQGIQTERHYNSSCYLAVPLMIGKELIGVLNITDKRDRTDFTEIDIMLIRQLTEKASIRIENNILYEGIYANLIDTLRSLIFTIEARDSYTRQHSQRVTSYAVSIARKLGFNDEEQEALKFSGILHDIGKIGVSDRILLKPGKLSLEEFNAIKGHPVIGDSIVEPLGLSLIERQVIRHHHERLDGKGYPDGLKGDEIPMAIRVVSVADAFDAMTTKRPYREPLSIDQAFSEMIKGSGSQLDQVVVDTLIGLVENECIEVPSGQEVAMTSSFDIHSFKISDPY